MGTPEGDRTAYDAVIVGARCAGASTAMLLARAGAKVLLVDRQLYGTDTVSTHALMRGAVLQLTRWGLLDRLMAAGTPPIEHSTVHYGADSLRIHIKSEHGVGHLCVPRRMVLDRLLVDAAREAGAEVRHGVTLADLLTAPDGRVTGATLKDENGDRIDVTAGAVIGADGRQSTVARRVGAQTYVEGAGASGYVYGYYADLPDEGYHWYFEADVAAGTIPTNDNLKCVFVGVPQDRFAATFRADMESGFLRVAEANAPALRDTIGNARPMGRLRGFSGGAGYLRQPHGPGWALVGDAGYFKDPLTAHGITDALVDAELLSRAVLDGSEAAFARYQQERDALSLPLLEVTDAIATFRWGMEEINDLHIRLSDAMKAECSHLAGLGALYTVAA